MRLEDYRIQYGGMSAAEVRRLIASSREFRNETESLYKTIYRRGLNKGCSDCWFDAYILLIRTDMNKLKAMKAKRFDLRAGAVLYDVNRDPKKTVTHHNLTDELALYHLRTNPDNIKYFSVYPENWHELAVQSAGEEPVKPTEPVTEELEEPVTESVTEEPEEPATEPAKPEEEKTEKPEAAPATDTEAGEDAVPSGTSEAAAPGADSENKTKKTKK